MATNRDAGGRFAAKPQEELSPAYRQRVERGTRRGLSLGRSRGHETRAHPAWSTQGVKHRAVYQRALEVLRRMRRGEGLYAAAHTERIAPDTVRRYVGSALLRDARGRYHAQPNDRFARPMRFLDRHGQLIVEVANAREASKLGSYWGAVHHYLATGDDRPLRRFRRMLLRTRNKLKLPFMTDLDLLDHLARAGELSFEDLYELTA